MPTGSSYRCGSGRVRSIRVEHERYTQPILRNQVLAHLGQYRFPRGNVRPADENRGAVQILWTACEYAPVDQWHHVLYGDAAVTEEVLNTRVHGDSPIEH